MTTPLGVAGKVGQMKTISLLILLGSLASASGAASLKVHEWGTFTSLQRSDGEQLAWLATPTEDLPVFVYKDLDPKSTRVGNVSTYMMSKGLTKAKLRMETPVIYFHSDEAMEANVRVDLPEGRLTEWYPVANQSGPSLMNNTNKVDDLWGPIPNNKAFIEWQDIAIHAPGQKKDLPHNTDKTHYYDARDTSANHISVPGKESPESEAFLFYRGIAHFESPVMLTENPDRALRIYNRLKGEAIENAIIIENTGGAILSKWTGAIPKGRNITVPHFEKIGSGFKKTTVAKLTREVVEQLTKAGLYEDEAKAMVSTWDDSWFEEKGTRVLYLLPQSWVDERMPLRVKPEPIETKRVMVARSELIRDAREWTLLKSIHDYAHGSRKERAQAINDYKALELGRFSGALVDRLVHTIKMPHFSEAVREMRKEAHPPTTTKLGLTSFLWPNVKP